MARFFLPYSDRLHYYIGLFGLRKDVIDRPRQRPDYNIRYRGIVMNVQVNI